MRREQAHAAASERASASDTATSVVGLAASLPPTEFVPRPATRVDEAMGALLRELQAEHAKDGLRIEGL